MKGYRFYLEHKTKQDKRKGKHEDNCIAIATDLPVYFGAGNTALQEGLSAVYSQKNSPVNWGGIGVDYLRDNCKRISEARAREIHPELFIRLDD